MTPWNPLPDHLQEEGALEIHDIITTKLRNTVIYREFGDFIGSRTITSSSLGDDLDAFQLLKQTCYNREYESESDQSGHETNLESSRSRKLQIVKASFRGSLEILRLKDKRSLMALASFAFRFWATNIEDFKKVWNRNHCINSQKKNQSPNPNPMKFEYAGCRLVDYRKESLYAEHQYMDPQGNLMPNKNTLVRQYEFADDVELLPTNLNHPDSNQKNLKKFKTHISPRSARIANMFLMSEEVDSTDGESTYGNGSYEFVSEDEGLLLYSGLGYRPSFKPGSFESWDGIALRAPIVKLKSHSRCAYPDNVDISPVSFGTSILRRLQDSKTNLSPLDEAYSQSILESPGLQSTSIDPRVALGSHFTMNMGPFLVFRMCSGSGGREAVSRIMKQNHSVSPRGVWVDGAENSVGIDFEEYEFLLPSGIQYIKTGEIYSYVFNTDDQVKNNNDVKRVNLIKRLEVYRKLGLLDINSDEKIESIAEEINFTAENNPQTEKYYYDAEWKEESDAPDVRSIKYKYLEWEKTIENRYGPTIIPSSSKSTKVMGSSSTPSNSDTLTVSENLSNKLKKLKNLNKLLIRVSSEQAKQKLKAVVSEVNKVNPVTVTVEESSSSSSTGSKILPTSGETSQRQSTTKPPNTNTNTNGKLVLVGIQLDIVGWNRAKFEQAWKFRQGIPESIPANQAITTDFSNGFTADHLDIGGRREWKWLTFGKGDVPFEDLKDSDKDDVS